MSCAASGEGECLGVNPDNVTAGANLNKADTTDGSTPLGTASQYGHTEVAAALIGAGADLNQADTTHGRTPLWSSSTSEHIGATRALIAAGNKPHHGE